MKILVLDDDAHRWHAFYNRLKRDHTEVTWANTAAEAIALLDKNDYDLVFLDHDLDPGAYLGTPKEPTGMDVVRYIIRMSHEFTGTQFVVHTLNGPAGDTMVSTLQDAGLFVSRAPFAWDRVKVWGE